MADVSRWRRLLEPVLTIGEYLGEPETRRSGRRVFLVAFVIATVFTIPSSVMDLAAGYTTVGVMNLVSAGLSFVFLLAMKIWPLRFGALVNGMFVLILLTQLAETAMFGGLLPSGLVVIFGLALGLAAMIAIGLRAAIWWTVAFSASVVLRAPTRPVSARSDDLFRAILPDEIVPRLKEEPVACLLLAGSVLCRIRRRFITR
ncbi:MAG: hypothetical protein ACXWZF_10385 [Actinomycetota bacterium]